MRLAIMQPYLLPYIGYFQLINAVDQFVIYDNIQFTKKGWINRNRILVNGKDDYITLSLKKDSDYLDVRERYLAYTWNKERNKMLNKIVECYKKAPYFEEAFSVVEKAILFDEYNLFSFVFNSLRLVKDYLEIQTQFIISSTINIDHNLKSENKVLEICKALKADQYINPSGGVNLYDKNNFKEKGIKLSFLRSNDLTYPQFNHHNFVPLLSIIDVIMFNSKEQVQKILHSYTLE